MAQRWTAANPDEKDFGFYFVQLANFMARQHEPVQDDGGWPGLREAQHMTLKLPNTGEAVIIDIGQADNIHPKDKMDVGKRLALAALHTTYHKEGVYTGPTYDSLKVEGNKALVKFDNIGGGLTIAAAPVNPARRPAGGALTVNSKGFRSPAKIRNSSGRMPPFKAIMLRSGAMR